MFIAVPLADRGGGVDEVGKFGSGLASPAICAAKWRATLLQGAKSSIPEYTSRPVFRGHERLALPPWGTAADSGAAACSMLMQVMGLAHKANIHQMFEVLRSEGDLQLIGAEASILENKWRK